MDTYITEKYKIINKIHKTQKLDNSPKITSMVLIGFFMLIVLL